MQVTIECEKTGYSTELEFKLRPFLGGGELTNAVAGRLKLGKETLATIDGHWDEKVVFKVRSSTECRLFILIKPAHFLLI